MKLLKRLRANLTRNGVLASAGKSAGSEPRVAYPGSGGKPFPALSAMLDSYRDGGSRDPILIFGDSVMERISRDDADKRSLGDMIIAALGGRALCLSQSAFNPAIYRSFATVLQRTAARPLQVILPVNLRCFSPQWDLHPAWQLNQELAAIDAYLRDGRIPMIEDVIEGPDFFRDYDSTRVQCALSQHSTAGEFRRLIHSVPTGTEERNQRAREIFRFHYACAFSQDHRKIRELVRCVEMLTKMQCQTLVYLTPINVDAGTSLAGSEWRGALRKNAQGVFAALQTVDADACRVRDWSERLSSAHFFHDDLATEHLNQHGRAALAALVAAEIVAFDRQ